MLISAHGNKHVCLQIITWCELSINMLHKPSTNITCIKHKPWTDHCQLMLSTVCHHTWPGQHASAIYQLRLTKYQPWLTMINHHLQFSLGQVVTQLVFEDSLQKGPSFCQNHSTNGAQSSIRQSTSEGAEEEKDYFAKDDCPSWIDQDAWCNVCKQTCVFRCTTCVGRRRDG